MRVIRPEEYRAMPWKNGGGVTTEICVSPPSGAFDWRVSIATVNADGLFSTFTGYERHIMTLSGEGMMLDIEGRGKFTLEPLQPFSFSGDAQVHGSLLQGAVLDFNLMVRRDFGSGTLQVRQCSTGDTLGSEESLCLAYVLKGECEAEGYQLLPNASFCIEAGNFFTLPAPLKLAICEIAPRHPPLPNA
jgi:environmental stress-induced protein Ves